MAKPMLKNLPLNVRSTIDKKIDQLLDRIIELDKPSLVAAYEKKDC